MADVPEVIGSELWCADKARLVLISGGKRRELIARLLSSHSSTLAYVRFRPEADIRCTARGAKMVIGVSGGR